MKCLSPDVCWRRRCHLLDIGPCDALEGDDEIVEFEIAGAADKDMPLDPVEGGIGADIGVLLVI